MADLRRRAVVAGYAVATWDRPHRTAILGLLGVAVCGGYVITHLPAAAIMRSRWREPSSSSGPRPTSR